jgi:hypothetical protein
MHPGDESGDHCRVLRGTTRNSIGDLRRSNLGYLAVRSAQAPRGRAGGCNPGKNARLKDGSKNDRIDARKLAGLWRGNQLKPVYRGETGVRMLRKLARNYLTIVKDVSRVMNRRKALYRSWAIPCAGRDVYDNRHRAEWLAIQEAGVRWSSGAILPATGQVEEVVAAGTAGTVSGKSQACHHQQATTDSIPGPIRSAMAVARIQIPHRFRGKWQLWAYGGLAVETRMSGKYSYATGQLRRSKKLISIRGLMYAVL